MLAGLKQPFPPTGNAVINSERALGFLSFGAMALVPLQLGCLPLEPIGDVDRLGCPLGEICEPTYVDLQWGVAVTCGSSALDRAPRSSSSVALGGRTWATATRDGYGNPVGATVFSEHFTPDDGRTTARATTLGAGRFTVYDVTGTVLDYVELPVMDGARAFATDGVTCPEDERALLRGHEATLHPLIRAADGTPLVDLDASIRTLSGERSVAPGPGSDRITFRIRYGAGLESLDTLQVVDDIDRVVPIETLTQQLRGAVVLAPLELPVHPTWLCFRPMSGTATLLGVVLDRAEIHDPLGGEDLVIEPDAPLAIGSIGAELQGACVGLYHYGTREPGELPTRTARVTGFMRGHTAAFDVEVLGAVEE